MTYADIHSSNTSIPHDEASKINMPAGRSIRPAVVFYKGLEMLLYGQRRIITSVCVFTPAEDRTLNAYRPAATILILETQMLI